MAILLYIILSKKLFLIGIILLAVCNAKVKSVSIYLMGKIMRIAHKNNAYKHNGLTSISDPFITIPPLIPKL